MNVSRLTRYLTRFQPGTCTAPTAWLDSLEVCCGHLKGVEDRLSTTKKQLCERRLAMRIEADDFSVENAAATLQIAGQSLAETGKRLEHVPIAGEETDTVSIGVK